jgi:NAD(P)-dependent dehydrogenase (short-subunit alcohol dehydrogenase family)
MDSLAVSYAGELARWGIGTTIIVPGEFTKGTNHFAHATSPQDTARAEEYAIGPTASLAETALKGLAALEPEDADPTEVAKAIARVVDTPETSILPKERVGGTCVSVRIPGSGPSPMVPVGDGV